MPRVRFDPYILVLIATIAFAAVLPVSGAAAQAFGYLVSAAIGLLFFLYGARLSPKAVLDGLSHWRLQGTVFLSTYALFPLLGCAVAALSAPVLPPDLRTGLLYLSLLPSTVQSSIAFTSIARGNVAAALTSASLSNLLGVVVTPLLVALLLTGATGGFDARAVLDIAAQILLPFLAGQLFRPLIGSWLAGRKRLTSFVDRGAIVLTVYAAFSEGVVEGIWSRVAPLDLVWVFGFCVVLLAAVMGVVSVSARVLGFSRPDRIAILFCGSKKSLATGIPMAGILFSGPSMALIVLPLMLFHQIQLFACALLAQAYAAAEAREETVAQTTPAPARSA
ncbi:bile acid:sodium symporter family protein [Ensifer soli]|uniref:bile acid:sodium symporter family protein n=1 Tax=Ciceribacter sp. sgz301302 TaxID=3342379 RepID=UPI0035B6B45B